MMLYNKKKLRLKDGVDNAEFLKAIKDSQIKGYATEELYYTFLRLSIKLGDKSCFNHPRTSIDKEDMLQSTLVPMLRCWNRFDTEQRLRPFAYFTTVAANAMAMCYKDLYHTYKSTDGKLYRIEKFDTFDDFVDSITSVVAMLESYLDDNLVDMLGYVAKSKKDSIRSLYMSKMEVLDEAQSEYAEMKTGMISELKQVPESSIKKIAWRTLRKNTDGKSKAAEKNFTKWSEFKILKEEANGDWVLDYDLLNTLYEISKDRKFFEIKIEHNPSVTTSICLDGEADICSV